MNTKQILCAAIVSVVLHIAARAEIPQGKFVDVKPIASLGEGTFGDCCNLVSPDGLHLLFSSHNRPERIGEYDIYQVSRTTAQEPFGPPTNVGAELNSFKTDAPSGISSDGLTLLFYSDRPGGEGLNDIYMATRGSLTEPFGNVTNLGPGVNTSSGESSAVLSNGGLTLYFHSDRPGGLDADELWQATRNSVNEPFGDATLVANINSEAYEDGPTISADGLHLFFFSWREGESDLFVANRANTNQPFGAPVNLNSFSLGSSVNEKEIDELTPYISPDWPATGSKLYFTRVINPNHINVFSIPDWDIYEATWISETAGVPGDYNVDGTVDAADYVVWRKGLGTIYTQQDYDVWQANFGTTAGSGAAVYPLNASGQPFSDNVPEPSASVLLLLTALVTVFMLRCRTDSQRIK
jgi:hypothetical protein